MSAGPRYQSRSSLATWLATEKGSQDFLNTTLIISPHAWNWTQLRSVLYNNLKYNKELSASKCIWRTVIFYLSSTWKCTAGDKFISFPLGFPLSLYYLVTSWSTRTVASCSLLHINGWVLFFFFYLISFFKTHFWGPSLAILMLWFQGEVWALAFFIFWDSPVISVCSQGWESLVWDGILTQARFFCLLLSNRQSLDHLRLQMEPQLQSRMLLLS